jgi:hypothetical protein
MDGSVPTMPMGQRPSSTELRHAPQRLHIEPQWRVRIVRSEEAHGLSQCGHGINHVDRDGNLRLQPFVERAGREGHRGSGLCGGATDHFPDAKGLLILANDGNYSLPPKLTMQLLGYRLRNRFSAIQSVVYFAPGMEVTGVGGAQRFWISGPAKESGDGVPPELLSELSRGWAEFNGCTVTVAADHSLGDKLAFAAVQNRRPRSQST